MKLIRDWQNNYVIRQVENLKLPEFKTSGISRREILFMGKVQKVGFRLEVFQLANKLGLTGWVENLADGSVRAQIQGEENRIDFLVQFMKSLRRAKVEKVEELNLEVKADEKEFKVKK